MTVESSITPPQIDTKQRLAVGLGEEADTCLSIVHCWTPLSSWLKEFNYQ